MFASIRTSYTIEQCTKVKKTNRSLQTDAVALVQTSNFRVSRATKNDQFRLRNLQTSQLRLVASRNQSVGRRRFYASLHLTLLCYDRLGHGSIDKLKPAPLTTVRDRSFRRFLSVLLDSPSTHNTSLVAEVCLIFDTPCL